MVELASKMTLDRDTVLKHTVLLNHGKPVKKPAGDNCQVAPIVGGPLVNANPFQIRKVLSAEFPGVIFTVVAPVKVEAPAQGKDKDPA